MSDWATLFAVAAALYLVECVAWIEGPATACFKPLLRGAWRGARGEDLPGNDRGGLALLDPLNIRGSLVVGRGWPFAMSPDGISNLGSDSWTLGRAEPRFITWSDIQTVQANFGTLDINGAPFARVGSTMLAGDLADAIRALGRLAATDRAAAVESAVRGALDENRVQDAWAEFCRHTRGLAMLASGLLGYVFVVAPAVLLGIAPHPYWMYILGGLVALALTAAILFFRLHSRFYPGFTFERWMHVISMVAIPIAAIRSAGQALPRVLAGVQHHRDRAELLRHRRRDTASAPSVVRSARPRRRTGSLHGVVPRTSPKRDESGARPAERSRSFRRPSRIQGCPATARDATRNSRPGAAGTVRSVPACRSRRSGEPATPAVTHSETRPAHKRVWTGLIPPHPFGHDLCT